MNIYNRHLLIFCHKRVLGKYYRDFKYFMNLFMLSYLFLECDL